MRNKLLIMPILLVSFVQASNITKRIQQFEEWHKQHPRTETVENLTNWENIDYKRIEKRLKGNQTALTQAETIHSALEGAKLSHINTELAYAGYSFILSQHILKEEDALPDAHADKLTVILGELANSVKANKEFQTEYYDPSQDGKFKASGNLFNAFSVMIKRIYDANNHNIPIIFFTSKSGLCTFRTLNHAAALKAPVAGLPLYRASYDGIEDALPLTFASHDCGHVFFNTNLSDIYFKKQVNDIYTMYGTIDSLIIKNSKAAKPEQTLLDDLALFSVGHENGITIGDNPNIYSQSANTTSFKLYPSVPLTATDFIKVCDYTKNILIRDIKSLTERVKVDYSWDSLKREFNLTDDQKEFYYKEKTKLHNLESKTNKGFIMSMVEYIEEKELPKDRTIKGNEAINIEDYILSTNDKDPFVNAANRELFFVGVVGPLAIDGYNDLFGLQNTFRRSKVPFDIWLEDGSFNKAGMVKAVTNLMDNFCNRYKDSFTA